MFVAQDEWVSEEVPDIGIAILECPTEPVESGVGVVTQRVYLDDFVSLSVGILFEQRDASNQTSMAAASPVGTRLRPYVYSSVHRVLIYLGKFPGGEM